MPQKKRIDVVEIVSHFQKDILQNKPTATEMYNEIRMMSFKIRPLNGDISLLNFTNENFLEILWSLGKLDEFFQLQYKKVSQGKKDLFVRLFDTMHDSFQEKLNQLNLKPEKIVESSSTFEMEIFKEKPSRKN